MSGCLSAPDVTSLHHYLKNEKHYSANPQLCMQIDVLKLLNFNYISNS